MKLDAATTPAIASLYYIYHPVELYIIHYSLMVKKEEGKHSLLFILTEGKSGTQEATGQAVSTAHPATGMKYRTCLLVAWHSTGKL